MAFVALIAYLIFVLIRPQEFVPAMNGMPLVKVSLIVAALFLFSQKTRRFDAPQNALLFWLLPIILLSGRMNSSFSAGFDSVITFVTSILLPFLILQNLIDTHKKQLIVMFFLIVSSLIMLHDGTAQKASLDGVGWSGASLSQGTRITYLGIFNDPNDLGMFFVMVLPCALYFFNYMQSYWRLLGGVASGFILYGIYLTNSRGALLGVMSQVALWVYLKYGIAKSALMGVVILPVALLVMSKFRTISSEEESAEGRLEAWYEGFQLLFWKPVLGVGMGQFTDHHYLTAHNSFVLVFSELGLSGYYLWVAFLAFSIFMLLVVWRQGFPGSIYDQASSQERNIARTLSYSVIGYLVTCFFLSRSYTPMLYIFCAMFVATFYRVTGYKKGFHTMAFKDFSGKVFLFFFSSLVLIYLTVRLLL